MSLHKKIVTLLIILLPPTVFASSHDVQLQPNDILQQSAIPVYSYKVVKKFPHNPKNFTEGLVYAGGYLYESSGLYGKSNISKMDLSKKLVIKQFSLPAKVFGEGITVFDNYLYQLSWASNIGFVRDRDSFAVNKTFTYPSQGWGLTHDDKNLIMSNGSSALLYIDPKTLTVVKYLLVKAGKQPVGHLNGLQYVDGAIYANVFMTNFIAKIDPKTGEVTAWINLQDLNPNAAKLNPVSVLNGIAYDPKSKLFLITGKNWSTIYAVQFIKSQPGLMEKLKKLTK